MRSINAKRGVILIGTTFLAISWGQGYTISLVAGGGSNDVSGVPATQDQVSPGGVAVDAAGNLYVPEVFAGANFVSKIAPNGIITTIAGSLQAGTGFSGDGGSATNAQFYFDDIGSPNGIAVDRSGNIYIADVFNNRVRKIDTNGIITTVAGGGNPLTPMYGDGGPATAAYLPLPGGIAVDSAGNLYIANGAIVRKVASNGTITTVAGCLPNVLSTCGITMYYLNGSIGDGGPATNAYLGAAGVAVDSAGNLYIADSVNNRIRKVSTSGVITTVVGSASGSYQGDGGPATSAGLNNPTGVAVDAAGNIYIDDRGDYRIRMVTTDGIITTIAGNGAQKQYGGNFGPAYPNNGAASTGVGLGITLGVALGPGGKIYVADVSNGVWLLTPMGSTGGAPPSTKGVVSASAFGQFPNIAPSTWIEIYGTNLAADLRGWAGSDFTGVNAPTSLDGTSVTIGNQSAFIDYISPQQVNAQVPSNVGTGPQSLIVTTAAGASSAYTVTVNATQPGLFAPFSVGGKQYAGALFSDGMTFAIPPGAVAGVPSRRAQLGDNITLYGIGFGSVAPSTPAGQIVPAVNSLTLPFKLFFGGTQAQVTYDGLAPGAVGLYQFNAVVPSIPASDTTPLTFTLGGAAGTQTLYIAVQSNITPQIQVQSLTLSASQTAGGGSIQGTVTLTGAAPAGGAIVALSSSSGSASVPATITVQAGSTSAMFTISTSAVTSNQSVTITAAYGGSSAQAALTLTPPAAALFSSLTAVLTFSPSGAASGQFPLTITPDAGNATYSATEGIGVTFTDGIPSNQGQTFTFNHFIAGVGNIADFIYGANSIQLSSASMVLTLHNTAQNSTIGLGTITGTLTITGTPLPQGGSAVTLSGPVSGSYTARL